MRTTNQKTFFAALAILMLFPRADAQAGKHSVKKHPVKVSPRRIAKKMVGYDAKDKRYYSVSYAKAHGMHDKGGDPLTIVPMSALPKEAKESKAMHGAKI